MPTKLFGIDLRRIPQQQQQTDLKDSSGISITTLRRPSMDHIKRPALAALGKKTSDKKSKDRSSSNKRAVDVAPKPTSSKPVKLNMTMESPPILMMSTAQESSGALISGQLQITPLAGDVIMESIVMYLECTTTTKQPVQDRCRECMQQVSDLYEWNFIKKPMICVAEQGMQQLPFSHLIPGHIPATTHGQIGSLDYSLHVRAKSSDGLETEFRRELVVRRALRPGNDKNSVRIFPPTNLTLHVTLPSVVHPLGEFPVQCRMTGITSKREDTQTRWRLRKLTWRIEEKETMISPACTKHAAKVGGEGKGLAHQKDRDVGSQEMKAGWKTDFDDGQIEGEFVAAIEGGHVPQCDVEAPNGLKISHVLVMELVIAEEWAPNKKPTQATPTGAARVLRTQFNLNVTDRAGMGISWDDEMPPAYEDVPASPPHYQNGHTFVRDYSAESLHGDVEDLTLNG
ncbi:Endocytosis regulator [Recurvomyces mirabilis]|nr:Endocytosis regulator [Recurvomyces mirabilis]